jgi:hypothetical protein
LNVDDRLGGAGDTVHEADARRRGKRSLLADEQPAVGRERHTVGLVRVGPHDRDLAGAQVEPLDVDLRARDRREVQGVLVSDVDRALVGVDRGDALDAPCDGRAHPAARAFAWSISHAAVMKPMWL